MAGINAVVLVGNLTQDPELRHTQGGHAVCDLRLAVNSREKVGDQWRDRADFFDVRAWGRLGENCAQYLSRGAPVGISGKLRFDEWQPEGSDKKRNRVLVVATDVQFLRSRGDGDPATSTGGGEFSTGGDGGFSTGGGDFGGSSDDDIPF